MIDVGSFLASHKSKIFLAMRGTSAPSSTPPKQKGAHPPYGNALMYLLVGGPRRKIGHFFLNNISQTKTSVGGLNKAFSPFETTKRGRDEKGVKRRVYRVMG
jgi:hypothetical protein